MYKPELLQKSLERMKVSPYKFDMEHWHVRLDGQAVSAIRACTGYQAYSSQYVAPPVGTSFCLAGFLTMFYMEELAEQSENGTVTLDTMLTETAALNYLGLGNKMDYRQPSYREDEAKDSDLRSIFFRKGIKTVIGMQRELKKAGLLVSINT